MTTPRIVVTAGPTIGADDIHAVIPEAEVVPPISFGDAHGYGLRRGDVLLIIDGLFLQSPSVRHKELLSLISDGVRVIGASSMGALRAAELHEFGMEGYGWVFEAYRDGLIEADDEVGMVHGSADDDYPVFVDALVNIRHTLAAAVAAGIVTEDVAREMISTAQRTPFTLRSWERLVDDVGAPRSLVRPLRAARVDIKHDDALEALRQIRRQPAAVASRSGPPETVWSSHWRQRWAPPLPVRVPTTDGQAPVPVTDTDVLLMLCVCSSDHWAWRPALQRIAVWYHDMRCTDPSCDTVDDRVSCAVAQTDCRSYERGLQTVAYHYALSTGVVGAAGFPDHVLSQWLTAEERELFAHDSVATTSRVLARTLFSGPSFPDRDHMLELMRRDPRLDEWRVMAARALAHRDEIGRLKPRLNVRRPDPALVRTLFGARWKARADRIELARRGLFTDQAFLNAASRFAAAEADGVLPTVQVGDLGAGCRESSAARVAEGVLA